MLQIRFLGQPRFAVDGESFKFTAPPKTLPLLAYLLLHRETPLARDALAFALWPDDTEEDARTDFRRHLNYLKNALPAAPDGTPWVNADSASVQWNPSAALWFDVAEFERLSTNALEHALATELYGGDLLETMYDDWLFPIRERLRGQHLSLLNELLLESRGRRDFAAATAYAQRILHADPWREDTLRQLMAVRYEAGDRAGALSEYDQFKRRLRDEMDVDLMPETTSLRDIIVRNAPIAEEALARKTTAATEERPSSAALPFVGRDAELGQLRTLWNRAAHGHGSTTLIGGEAGIGKTRLAAELALLVGAQGGRVLFGATLRPESAPYQPIAEALRSALPLLQQLDVQPLWLAAVAQLVPELRSRRPDLPQLPHLDAGRERLRLFEAVAACLHALAKPRPVLLVLEDLHWAGEATIAALEYLTRASLGHYLLIVGTYRDEEVAPPHALRDARRRLQRDGLATHLVLSRLAESVVRDLLERVPEMAGRCAQAAAALFQASEGNPLFLGEAIRDFVESGAATPQPVPRGLQGTINARLSRLSEPATFIAQIAATLGTAFDIDVVSEVSGWPESQVLDAVEELVLRHVVRETGRRAAFDYAFTHHLVQVAMYDGISADGRTRWHRHAAHAMQRIYANRGNEMAAVLAYHFEQAGELAAAAAQYLNAARHAFEVFANEAALDYVKRGLQLSGDAAQRQEFLGLRESVLSRLGARDEQKATLEALERSAQSLGSDDLRADVLNRWIALHETLGERDAQLRDIERLAQCAQASGQPRWLGRAALARATYEMHVGNIEAARASMETAASTFSSAHDAGGEAECLCLLAYLDALQARSADTEERLTRAHRAAESTGNQALLARSLYTASTAAIMRLDYKTGQAAAERALELYRAIGDRDGEADCCMRLGMAAARRFDVDASREWYAKARTLYRSLGKKQGQGAVALNAGVAEIMIGQVAAGLALFREAEPIFADLGDMRGIAATMIDLGMACYAAGNFEEAKQWAAQGLAATQKLGSKHHEAAALGNLGVAERELGELDAAIEHLRAAVELRTASGGHADAPLDLAELTIAYVRAGMKDEALRCADRLMALDPKTYEVNISPHMVPWGAAQAYRLASKPKQAKAALELAQRLRRQRIEALPTEELREAFRRVWFNRELTEAAR